MGQIGDGTGEGGRNCGDQDVPVFYMSQFMGHDPGQFLVGEEPHDAGRGGNSGMLRVATGGKGVRAVVLNDVHLRHRQSGTPGKGSHDPVETGVVTLLDRLRPVHPEHDLVGEPVGKKVHPPGQQKGCRHPPSAADCAADQYQQHRQQCH